MGRRKAPRWTREEVAILREAYPAEGLNGVADLLPERSRPAIHQMASRIGLRTEARANAPKPKLGGGELEEAIRLREQEGWSFARIGATFGVCETSASNAVLMSLCTRKGFRPAERDEHGHLTEEAKDRLRLMLRKGFKAVDIQLRLGVSAACVAEQRRRYAADLKARGKAPLPPPGGGVRYSGARIPRATTRQIEALYLEGYGTAKISSRTGVSKTHCLRTRTRLVKALRRKGEALPGCDANGVRRVHKDSARLIPVEARAELRRQLLRGEPVRSAARLLGIGLTSAYRIRAALIAELKRALPAGNWRSRPRHGQRPRPIEGTANILRYRQLCQSMPVDAARAALFAERDAARAALFAERDAVAREAEAAERARRQAENAARANRSFAEKLADVARGESMIFIEPPMRRRGNEEARAA